MTVKTGTVKSILIYPGIDWPTLFFVLDSGGNPTGYDDDSCRFSTEQTGGVIKWNGVRSSFAGFLQNLMLSTNKHVGVTLHIDADNVSRLTEFTHKDG